MRGIFTTGSVTFTIVSTTTGASPVFLGLLQPYKIKPVINKKPAWVILINKILIKITKIETGTGLKPKSGNILYSIPVIKNEGLPFSEIRKYLCTR